MPRKVFISVLGTGHYTPCEYILGTLRSSCTRFVQCATLVMLTCEREWTAADRGYILLTDGARAANWDFEGNEDKRPKADASGEYLGLKEELQRLHLPFEICPMHIKDGKDESEIWEIFDVIFRELETGDELYFDVTHGFRYLPMLVLVMGNYAKYMKQVSIQSVTYGNIETADRTSIPWKAPIVDVTSFSVLQDWSFSGASFVRMGRFTPLTDSLKSYLHISDKSFEHNLRKLNKNLLTWENQIAVCRGKEIMAGRELTSAKTLVRRILDDTNLPKPLRGILEDISREIDPFPNTDFGNLQYAISWCRKYDMIQQGYTLCQETIVTYLCRTFAPLNPYIEEHDSDRRYREFWYALLGISKEKVDDVSQWKAELSDNVELVDAFLRLTWVSDIRGVYDRLRQCRNQVNHGGFWGNVSSDKLIASFRECVKDSLSFLQRNDLEWPESQDLFINISNHPSAGWSKEQKEAAKAYGKIVDIPFPDVSPDASPADVGEMADGIVAEVRNYALQGQVVAHVMGEMSLTYSIVERLLSENIRCVCSTTRRIVAEVNGKKVVEFHFERFREY